MFFLSFVNDKTQGSSTYYDSGFYGNNAGKIFVREEWLKEVNQDDEIDSTTFSELMDKLKSPELVKIRNE